MFSKSLHGISYYTDNCCNIVKYSVKLKIISSIYNNSIITAACNKINEPAAYRVTCNNDKCTPYTSIKYRQPYTLLNPVNLASTYILSAIGCHSLSKYCKHNHKYLRYLTRRSMCHDNVLSELIDSCLESKRADIYK